MSGQTMVFVDAGYLWGVMATVHGVERIDDLVVSYEPLATLLRDRIEQAVGPVLRIRWYDATDPTRRITNPRAVGMAQVPGVRLVEGRLARHGGQLQQKAVDTRLVADMVTIAHQHQTERFVLLTGDEDMVPGVEAAEDLGLHVEVWSIEADDAAPTVSRELVSLADTHRTINAQDLKTLITPVRSILTTIAQTPTPPPVAAPAPAPAPGPRPIPRPPRPRPTTTVDPTVELPNLWGIDQDAYHRPLTSDMPTNLTPQQQATHTGAIYARRWWHAANPEAREHIGAICPGPHDFQLIPTNIDKDLLRFAEDHDLDTWTHTWAKTCLRNGWWDEIDELTPADNETQP